MSITVIHDYEATESGVCRLCRRPASDVGHHPIASPGVSLPRLPDPRDEELAHLRAEVAALRLELADRTRERDGHAAAAADWERCYRNANAGWVETLVERDDARAWARRWKRAAQHIRVEGTVRWLRRDLATALGIERSAERARDDARAERDHLALAYGQLRSELLTLAALVAFEGPRGEAYEVARKLVAHPETLVPEVDQDELGRTRWRGWGAQVLAHCLTEMLDRPGGGEPLNYFSISMRSAKHGPLEVLVQRVSGLTPAQKNMELVTELAERARACATLASDLERARAEIDANLNYRRLYFAYATQCHALEHQLDAYARARHRAGRGFVEAEHLAECPACGHDPCGCSVVRSGLADE